MARCRAALWLVPSRSGVMAVVVLLFLILNLDENEEFYHHLHYVFCTDFVSLKALFERIPQWMNKIRSDIHFSVKTAAILQNCQRFMYSRFLTAM